jgi:hypothetical protein
MAPEADIKDHIRKYQEQMPLITGPKGFAIPAAVITDVPD